MTQATGQFSPALSPKGIPLGQRTHDGATMMPRLWRGMNDAPSGASVERAYEAQPASKGGEARHAL